MKIESLKLVYFSPTGTTKAIIQGIAGGMHAVNTELIDITKPAIRKQPMTTSKDDLLIVGVPVYVGRVPALVMEWLHLLVADHTPVVSVVVYGNRAYEDALLELNNSLAERGCKPIAAAAYIGEHSFSDPERPIAAGRPDASDLQHAANFGRRIYERLLTANSAEDIELPDLPGNYPYRGSSKLWDVDFVAVGNECRQCGLCADICPVGAVDPENSSLIDIELCITCCACIKNCPQQARTMKPGIVNDVAAKLHRLFQERNEPELFL